MTAPIHSLSEIPRLPDDAAFDAVELGSSPGPFVDPRAGTRVDAAAMQRMMGNQAVLRSRQDASANEPTNGKPLDGQPRLEKKSVSPANDAIESDIPTSPAPLDKVVEAVPSVPASPPVIP